VAAVIGRAPARIVRGPGQGPDRVLRSDIAGNRAGDAVALLVGEVAGQFVVDTLDAQEAGDRGLARAGGGLGQPGRALRLLGRGRRLLGPGRGGEGYDDRIDVLALIHRIEFVAEGLRVDLRVQRDRVRVHAQALGPGPLHDQRAHRRGVADDADPAAVGQLLG